MAGMSHSMHMPAHPTTAALVGSDTRDTLFCL